ncbi:MAG: hypothetical protein RLP02_10380 [Coleofasciculus sp. C2-GNP5-27]
MTVALYMDEHIRRSITLGLRLRGIDVLTVQEDVCLYNRHCGLGGN